jgi:hypothetical protein
VEEKGRKSMELGETAKEREVVRKIRDQFLEANHPTLKKMFVHTNLATRKFHEIWKDWWTTGIPPCLEVDMILVYEDPLETGKVLMVGVEAEYFRNKSKNFYDGLDQVVSFGIFGFDSLILWHIFSEELSNTAIDEYVKPVREIIEGLRLPVVYLATKITKKFEFEFFYPLELYSSAKLKANQLITSLRSLCDRTRNPLLSDDEIEKRKKTMKLILRIPI